MGPGQVAPPGREPRRDRAPVGVQDSEALGERQACEEGPAAAAHAWLGQVDRDPGEARGGGGGGLRRPGPRSPPSGQHRGPGLGAPRRRRDTEKPAGEQKESRRKAEASGGSRLKSEAAPGSSRGGKPRPMQIRSGRIPPPESLGGRRRSRAPTRLGVPASRLQRPRLYANRTGAHAFYLNYLRRKPRPILGTTREESGRGEGARVKGLSPEGGGERLGKPPGGRRGSSSEGSRGNCKAVSGVWWSILGG